MKTSRDGIKLIISFEGYHKRLPNGDCTTYVCPAGVLTIGHGTTTGFKAGEVWTQERAVAALKADLRRFEDAVNRLVKVEIGQHQFDALVSFAYNCGEGALAKSGLLRKLNAGDPAGAAKEFGKWTRGGGKVLPGLVRRRKEEAVLFCKPDDNEVTDLMPQAVDEPKPDAMVAASTLYQSRTIWATLAGMFWWVCGVVTDTLKQAWDWAMWSLGLFPEIKAKTTEALSMAQDVAGWFSFNLGKISTVIAVVCILVVLVRHAQLRLEAKS